MKCFVSSIANGDEKFLSNDEVNFLVSFFLAVPKAREVQYEINEMLIHVHSGFEGGCRKFMHHKRIQIVGLGDGTNLILRRRLKVNPCKSSVCVLGNHEIRNYEKNTGIRIIHPKRYPCLVNYYSPLQMICIFVYINTNPSMIRICEYLRMGTPSLRLLHCAPAQGHS